MNAGEGPHQPHGAPQSDLPPVPTTTNLSTPPSPARRGVLGTAWAIVGVATGFVSLIVPGIFALRSYRTWKTGVAHRPTFAWAWAWIFVLSGFLVIGLIDQASHGLEARLPPVHVAFRDDFSNPSSGWRVVSQAPQATADFDQGTYRIVSTGAMSTTTTAIRTVPTASSVAKIEVDVRQVPSRTPPGSQYAISCAVDASGRDVYSFVIAPARGAWSIVHRVDGGASDLAVGSSPNIRQGAALNRVEAVCDSRGTRTFLHFYVDGTEVGNASEDVPATSYSTMAVSVFSTGPDEVRFDNAVFLVG